MLLSPLRWLLSLSFIFGYLTTRYFGIGLVELNWTFKLWLFYTRILLCVWSFCSILWIIFLFNILRIPLDHSKLRMCYGSAVEVPVGFLPTFFCKLFTFKLLVFKLIDAILTETGSHYVPYASFLPQSLEWRDCRKQHCALHWFFSFICPAILVCHTINFAWYIFRPNMTISFLNLLLSFCQVSHLDDFFVFYWSLLSFFKVDVLHSQFIVHPYLLLVGQYQGSDLHC